MTERIDSMLDPSLFSDNSYESTLEMVSEQRDEISFSVSDRFYELVSEDRLTKTEPVRDYFSAYSSFYEYESMRAVLEEADISLFSAEEYYQDYNQIYNSIADTVVDRRYFGDYGEENYLPDILFDEFIFSIEHSPVLSRLKKISESFKNAVYYTVEISEQKLEENWSSIQRTVEYGSNTYNEIIESLKENAEERLDENEPIFLSTYLRQAVKDYSPNWIIHISTRYISALAGVAVGGMIGGAAGGAMGALTGPAIQDFVMYLADP